MKYINTVERMRSLVLQVRANNMADKEMSGLWKRVEEKAVVKLENVRKASHSRKKADFEKAHQEYCEFLSRIANITGMPEETLDKSFSKAWEKKMAEEKRNEKNH